MVEPKHTDTKEIWEWLEAVKDPEVPVLSVIDLGVVRDISIEGQTVNVTITPTYSGCPAMKVIEDDIIATVKKNGISDVVVNTIVSPAWTTDWLSEAGRKKLFEYGIAPPERGQASPDKGFLFAEGPKNIQCPNCKSRNTMLKSQFGSTACKALYICNDCLEPFDYFKCL